MSYDNLSSVSQNVLKFYQQFRLWLETITILTFCIIESLTYGQQKSQTDRSHFKISKITV
jgi:hypothetical protein